MRASDGLEVSGVGGRGGRTKNSLGAHERAIIARAASVSGHSDEDWAVLASVRDTTEKWSASVGELLGRCARLAGEPSEPSSTEAREELEQGIAAWFQLISSGRSGHGIWAETAFIGLSQVASGLSTSTMLAFLNRLDSLLTLNCGRALPSEQAVRVGRAYTHVLGVAKAIMIHAHELALTTGVTQLGLSPRLMTRLRSESVPRMIGEARGAIALLTWDDSLVVGIAALDEARQELLERLEQVHQASDSARGAALAALADFAVASFAAEERLYEQHGLPELEVHRAGHRLGLTRLLVFTEDWRERPATASLESFTTFFRGWLSEHLRRADRAAGAQLRAGGAS